MYPKLDKVMMRLRMESKERENQAKLPIHSPDVVQTSDFTFSKFQSSKGDSGQLLLAKRKNDCRQRYLVKHACTDCACNEFVYTKLARAMGYCMPDAVLFQLSKGEKRPYFESEYIIGERYLNVIDSAPSYTRIREGAKNWKEFFAFYALYSITKESDCVEVLLADDDRIYRVDTTDAFVLDMHDLDIAGIDKEIGGHNPYSEIKSQLLSSDFTKVLDASRCDFYLDWCYRISAECRPYFLEPFALFQEISASYIDDFLNTLCYFYPDYIGDYFKLYISAIQKQCAEYWKEKH